MPLSIIASFSLQQWKRVVPSIRSQTRLFLNTIIKYLWDGPTSLAIHIVYIAFHTVSTTAISTMCRGTTRKPSQSSSSLLLLVDNNNSSRRTRVVFNNDANATTPVRPVHDKTLVWSKQQQQQRQISRVVITEPSWNDDDDMDDNVAVANSTNSNRTTSLSSSSVPTSKLTGPCCNNTTTTTTSTASTTSSSSTSTCNKRRNRFLTRSLASRTISFIESELENVTSRSNFLNSTRTTTTTTSIINDDDDDATTTTDVAVPRLHRTEIVTGELLGQGGFSQVYAIEAFRLSSNDDDDTSFTDQDCQLRMELACSAASVNNHRPSKEITNNKYVVKHLRPDLRSVMSSSGGVVEEQHRQQQQQRQQRTFHSAAADLVIEATFLSKMDHPNIMKLRGWAAGGVSCFRSGDNSSYFLILDRLDETLAQRIEKWRDQRRGGLTTRSSSSSSDEVVVPALPTKLELYREKLDYADQLASAIQYLHHNRIMHRDITPNNVGIIHNVHDGTDTIQLFDFGLVRELPAVTLIASFSSDDGDENDEESSSTTYHHHHICKDQFFHMSKVGTCSYMAPEVSSGCYNQQADIYSFTMVLYAMMTLIITPITKSEHEEMIHQQHVGECSEQQQQPHRPAVLTQWAVGLQELFHRGWSISPIDRPDIDELRQRLHELIANEDQQQQQTEQGNKLVSVEKGNTLCHPPGSTQPSGWSRSVFHFIPDLLVRKRPV